MAVVIYTGPQPAIRVPALAGRRFIEQPELWDHLGVDEYDGVVPQGVAVDVPGEVAVELLEEPDWHQVLSPPPTLG